MRRDGKNLGAIAATLVCFAFIFCTALPPTWAQATDTTPPVTVANMSGTVGNNGWYTSSVTVTLNADDLGGSGVAHTYYRLDGNALVTYGSGFPITDGRHSLLYYSVDNAGNQESAKITSINVDTVKPTLNLTITGNLVSGVYNSTNTTANITAFDNGSRNVSIAYSFDNVNWYNYTGNFTLPDGSYTLYYGSMDWAGNVNNSTKAITVFNPGITFDPLPNKWYTDREYILIYISQTSNVDHVDYSINVPGNWINAKTSSNNWLNFTNEGNATIYYRAVSPSGTMSGINSVWYGLDRSAPTIDLSIDGYKDKSKGWWTSDITVHINVHDAGPVTTEWSWDQSHWTTYTDPFKVNKQSSKTLYYRTTDVAGRSASGSAWIYFVPQTMNQGAMSDSVWINGQLYSGNNPSATAKPTQGPTPQPTKIPIPTPEILPSPTAIPDVSSGSGNPLAIAVLVGVLVLLGICAAAVYLFVFNKPKTK